VTHRHCNNPDCTIDETGLCVLSHKNPFDCPHYVHTELLAQSPDGSESETPVREGTDHVNIRTFHSGLELGTGDLDQLMKNRYCHMIGVLGLQDAGKTCFLVSLYLMAAHGRLPSEYAFAGSLTLPGFEARARHMRAWTGGDLPQQLADHTSLSDPRRPAFLNLRLRRSVAKNSLVEMCLTDLPGEWTRALMDREDAAMRFSFLHRADGIILVVDGTLLEGSGRHAELDRAKHILTRLVRAVGVDVTIPLVLLLSKCDMLTTPLPPLAEDLLRHAEHLQFTPKLVLCSAFSRKPEVRNGTGIIEALEYVIRPAGSPVSRLLEVPCSGKRCFHRFRQQQHG
jgi:hypothetical protein